jgi:NAD(P)-dependent dehydrogenase (short-subunit alcohol dehydrogenase family)
MLGGFGGRVALVTGGGAGIGEAVARLLATGGADVAVLDRDLDAAEQVAQTIRALGRRAAALELDVTETWQIAGAVDDVLEQLGRIDILVQNAYAAGAASPAVWRTSGTAASSTVAGTADALLEISEETWDRIYAANVKAPMLFMQQVGRHMIERGGGGRIVNITSSSAFRALSAPAYGSSKAALNQLSRTAAAELGPHGITVNNVAPGRTRTPTAIALFGEDQLDSDAREGSRANLLGRFASADDVAVAAVFLCLPEAGQITAETIHTSAGSGL